jgi:hypothetical protein
MFIFFAHSVQIKEIKLAEAVASLIRHGFDFDQESVDEELGSLDNAHVETLNVSNIVQKIDEMQLHADLAQSWEQTVLDNELRCVGLNKHADAASWCMSILKILLYPDMIDGYRLVERGLFVVLTLCLIYSSAYYHPIEIQ